MSYATKQAISWTEQGLVPDTVIRTAIRRLLRARLTELRCDDIEHVSEVTARFVADMNVGPIAPLPEKANEQHYELPAEFFREVLGPYRKYSACLWREGVESLEQAEAAALETTCDRADLTDGQRILELGCGWGSLSLYMAARYPRASIVAVSNSNAQREYIVGEARRRRLNNLVVLTRDMNDFDIEARFDRVVSIEMFEHMRNYAGLFERISRWLVPGGRFFLHIFVHRNVPYEFVERDADDWMSRHFFSGGMMPSAGLPLHFQDHLRLQRQWSWSGLHYASTANAWLANLDAHRKQVLPILASVHGLDEAEIWLQRWRIFFMACAELWGFREGREWFVSHYLFEPRSRR
ncbi:MAG: cyclopropane-fatty-acyl-phospholipid synthase family protein [Steroidobacteraceae bacterium]